ncbi:radiation-inducible immediate-early gene IEX-1-like [Hemitrygon akajei]|uniref:radiation-inducible immediate-early gene IEX-1-like n=1 Tax=Hemitrygon akajei TaxID=2704970 RepID=UPI003BF98415
MCLARGYTERPGMAPVSYTKDQPLIFNFEPITEPKPKVPGKKRRRRVLYPVHPVRKVPAQTDVAKRLFLIFLSVVILQVYCAIEDEPGLSPVEASRPSDQAWSGDIFFSTASTATEAHCIHRLVWRDLWETFFALRCPLEGSQLGV